MQAAPLDLSSIERRVIPRVLLVDPDTPYRTTLRDLLTSAGIVIVGETPNGRDAVTLALTLNPDVVLMELSLAGLDGIAAAQLIRANHPDIEIVMVTTYEQAMLRDTPGVGLYLYAIMLKQGSPNETIVEMVQRACRRRYGQA